MSFLSLVSSTKYTVPFQSQMPAGSDIKPSRLYIYSVLFDKQTKKQSQMPRIMTGAFCYCLKTPHFPGNCQEINFLEYSRQLINWQCQNQGRGKNYNVCSQWKRSNTKTCIRTAKRPNLQHAKTTLSKENYRFMCKRN